MAGAPYRVLVDRLGGSPTFARGEIIDGLTAAAIHLQAARLEAAGAIEGLGPDPEPLVAGYTGTGPLSARPTTPDVPEGATAFYFATDTGALSTWDGSAWSDSAAHPIKFENWDSVVAPAIPAGWSVGTPLVTSSTNNPTSAPNSLVYPMASVNASLAPLATWTTLDTGGGNVQVSATVRFTNSGSGAGDQSTWLIARSPTILTTAADWAGCSCYFAGVDRNGGGAAGLFVGKMVSGTQTNFGGPSIGPAAFADATNYRVTLSCLGSTIKAGCQRLSDGYWLNSSGVFVSDPTNTTWVRSVTDTSIAATAGYAGIGFYVVNGNGGPVGVDDWLLEAL